MQKSSNRMNKINEELKKEIGIIISQELRDPHITGLVSVTKVVTTPDLRFARVYVSMIGAKSNKGNLARLKKCSGHIRSLIAKKVNLRNTPELIFEFDESIEYGARIDSIINEITAELKDKHEDE
ncbi:MAG: 30S ribosome-binding factor RbfA [Clostridia bacterium]|nr:30S ribosome-binding factor RbfA [Clostridia bacterium]